MDYNILLDLATDLGYELAMCGAETFRVEESVSRVLSSYGIASEVFAIPNYLIVTVMMEDGTPITRMRRIGSHGNDLDAVEKFSGLSRAYCSQRPEPKEAQRWLEVTRAQRLGYPVPIIYLCRCLRCAGGACDPVSGRPGHQPVLPNHCRLLFNGAAGLCFRRYGRR